MSDMKDAKRGQGYDAEAQWAHQQQQEALKKMRQKGKAGDKTDDKSDKDCGGGGDGKACGASCKGGKSGKCKGKAGCPKCAENAKKK